MLRITDDYYANLYDSLIKIPLSVTPTETKGVLELTTNKIRFAHQNVNVENPSAKTI